MRNVDVLRLKDDIIKRTNEFILEHDVPLSFIVMVYESILNEVKSTMNLEIKTELTEEALIQEAEDGKTDENGEITTKQLNHMLAVIEQEKKIEVDDEDKTKEDKES